jgi:phage terminase large subunit-like protein
MIEPRLEVWPRVALSAGKEVVDLCEIAGLTLDPWQARVIELSLGELEQDGRWAAAEVGLCVPRQNGKNVVLAARELGALFVLEEELTIHSAQQFKTAKEHFLRLLELIESSPDLDAKVLRVIRTHGEEAIEVQGRHGRLRILFMARTKSSGRGFSAPLIVFDEAMFLPEAMIGALIPTQSAMANRQRWFAGSAVDQQVHADGLVFARVRDRAVRDVDDRLAFFEWSVDADHPSQLSVDQLQDEGCWAAANPGFGTRVTAEAVGDELRAMDRRTFAVERLGVGDWPSLHLEAETVIDLDRWAELVDPGGELQDPVCFAFDVTPDRSWASIAVAGRRDDGLHQLEVRWHRPGTGWVVPELVRMRDQWDPVAVMCDGTGPAGSLLPRCDDAGVDVEIVTASDHAKACGLLVDMVDNDELRHLGADEMLAALRGATQRRLGDAWAWSRKSSLVDISPLVASTLALWGSATLGWDAGEDPIIY